MTKVLLEFISVTRAMGRLHLCTANWDKKAKKFMDQEIKNAHGETLDYTFHAGQENARNLLIIGHGVTGNKDRPFVVALAEAVAASDPSGQRAVGEQKAQGQGCSNTEVSNEKNSLEQ